MGEELMQARNVPVRQEQLKDRLGDRFLLASRGRPPPIRGALAPAVVQLPVGFERAVEQFSAPVDEHHQIFGGIPGIHQHGSERQLLGFEGVVEHVPHVVELGFAVAVGVVHPPFDDPMLAGVQQVDVAEPSASIWAFPPIG